MQLRNEHDPQFLSLSDVARKVRMGESTITAWEATKKFPQAVRLSTTKRVWLKSEVDAWMLEQSENSKKECIHD